MSACIEPPVPKLFYHEFRFDEKRYTSACIEPPVPKIFIFMDIEQSAR
jgi:hypothetical protein